MKPYFIFTPEWSKYSAGVVVLHTLAHRLSQMGMSVYLHTGIQNPAWKKLPTVNEFKGDRNNVVAVYPDIVNGNPYKCKYVARYFLHIPGFFGGQTEFDKKEMLFVHSDLFNQRVKLPKNRVVFFPYLDTNIFYDMKLERTLKFYFKRKDNGTYPDPRIAEIPSIGTGRENESEDAQKALAVKLNQTKVLYCYDNVTAMIDIARLCGCAVVMVPDGFWTEMECRCFGGWEAGGIAYGIEHEAEALASVSSEAMREYYTVKAEHQAKRSLKEFVEITQRAN